MCVTWQTLPLSFEPVSSPRILVDLVTLPSIAAALSDVFFVWMSRMMQA